ncbi:hypothetical protein [Sphingomonas nostoxanthinifaciens]|uniref:hypothetical protein n=1 Tax=Sphingomonas nostoxanthinifaciens TaxID=2872652 RepID=UPI001CC21C86|nr:hypothetical protein [Sphingomonas nostoxanthinifaciens]UAK23492.1 hypothetical protein K8P63_13985 [Sphingomonas nostoxanthinifaciens]
MSHPACTLDFPMLDDGPALFDWGLACSVGSGGVELDLIEAHKWFNLAALAGDERGAEWRADIAATLSRADIREAQRRARLVLQ